MAKGELKVSEIERKVERKKIVMLVAEIYVSPETKTPSVVTVIEIL